jgi:hypothetical protein
MARSYYRRRWYGRRTFRKKNWSTNIITSETSFSIPANTTYGSGSAICVNPSQSVSTVSQPFTVKNVKLSICVSVDKVTSVGWLGQIIAAIVYVPQGYTVTYKTLVEHPEWFMATKFIENPQVDDAGLPTPNYLQKPFTVSTRLARKLQTGDSIQLCIFATNRNSEPIVLSLSFMAQWWTCSN